MAKQTKKTKEIEKKGPICSVGTRGRSFEGTVIKTFPHRLVVELERIVYVKKYQRFQKKKFKIHARLPEGMNIIIGDYIKVRECRPLSKIIHSVVIEKIRSAGTVEGEKK
ncbi:30S ribosomal protein S17 [Candidatus Pacearchaeota archaeon CG10_big_fil_rev_8_21_14_0_10_31_24]|nr:MAG: 30S ribosomal protein S17 [Candidatus Pacearchaeota archaeon CG10_big_fil_rev_8_21_14_0_10_31_24]